MRIKHALLAGILLFSTAWAVSAQSQPRTGDTEVTVVDPFSMQFFSLTSPYIDLEIEPRITLGSHVTSAGAQVQTLVRPFNPGVLGLLFLYAQVGYEYSFSHLGIPEPSHLLFASGAFGASWGQRDTLANNFFPNGERSHTFLFQYNYYLDSINTSSATGLLSYQYSLSDFLFAVTSENDALGFMDRDEFRTSSLEFAFLFGLEGDNVLGAGFGARIWTGAHPLNDTLEDQRGNEIDISQNIGGAYTHGLLYGSIYFNSLKLSVGWDSEEIRGVIQNGWHYLVNESPITLIDRPDRFYIQFEINPRFSTY